MIEVWGGREMPGIVVMGGTSWWMEESDGYE
jgi:hypothetical protein